MWRLVLPLCRKQSYFTSSLTKIFFTSAITHKHEPLSLIINRCLSTYWDYSEENGPEHWQKTWNLTRRQSPIDIITNQAVYDKQLASLNVDTSEINIVAKNAGLNISFQASDYSKQLILSGGPLQHQYVFREMHFHWGEVHNEHCQLGCEHTIDGKRYAAELHVVHWNRDLYETEDEALCGVDGLAVTGVFLDAKPSHSTNKNFNVITNMFKKVTYRNMHATFSMSPYSLFPQGKQDYFTYAGSLTTPPLTENVTWIVFSQPVQITLDQLAALSHNFSFEEGQTFNEQKPFKRLANVNAPTITNNYRPTQPSNNRLVRASLEH